VPQYAGFHVSLEQSNVCVMDATGRLVWEGKAAISPLGNGPEVAAIHQNAMQHRGQLSGQRHLGALHPRRLATSFAQRCQAE